MSGPLESLVDRVIAQVRARGSKRPALIGVGGAQGSGKTTLCSRYVQAHPRIAHFSLDDVYLTRAERERKARAVHPLFLTRGPPGTHDLALAERIVASLESASARQMVRLPRFDKACDERADETLWPPFEGAPDAILIDGWCLGALPLSGDLDAPLNALERDADPDGRWRRAVAAALAGEYQTFFDRFDAAIHLKAPSWEIVRVWRGQQEQELRGRALSDEESAALDRFVMHYERVTRAMLGGGHRARWIVHLDDARRATRVEEI